MYSEYEKQLYSQWHSVICHMYTEKYPLKEAMKFGTFKSIDFKKKWYIKVPVVPRSLML